MERFKFTVGYVTNSPSFWAFIGSLIFILAFVHEYSFKFLGNSLKWVPFVKINGKAFRTVKRETFLAIAIWKWWLPCVAEGTKRIPPPK